MALFMAVAISSCSSTPVTKVCDTIDKIASNIAKVENLTEGNEIMNELDGVELTDAEKEYKLTESDKEALKDSFQNLFNAIVEKDKEIGDGSAALAIGVASGIINSVIDESETLGDIEKNMNAF